MFQSIPFSVKQAVYPTPIPIFTNKRVLGDLEEFIIFIKIQIIFTSNSQKSRTVKDGASKITKYLFCICAGSSNLS